MKVSAGIGIPHHCVLAVSDSQDLSNQAPGSWDRASVESVSKQLEAFAFQDKAGNIATVSIARGNGFSVGFVVGARGIEENSRQYAQMGACVGERLKGLSLDEITVDVFKNTECNGVSAIDKAVAFFWGLYSHLTYISRKDGLSFADNLPKEVKFAGLAAGEIADIQERTEGVLPFVEQIRKNVEAPANLCSPEFLVTQAKAALKDTEARVTIMNASQLESAGLNLVRAVGAASSYKSQFAVFSWKVEKDSKPFVLIGKGVTMDTGGLCIKDRHSMYRMNRDMAGASLVLSLFQWAVSVGLDLPLVAVVPIVENALDSSNFFPGSVIHSYSGKYVEIVNTDAEGRLLLADAISYAQKNFDAQEIMTLATLTGATLVSFGDAVCPVYGNDENSISSLRKAAETEKVALWHMPFAQKKSVHSDRAHVKTGFPARTMQYNGAGVAAQFLNEFVEVPWVHLDIVGMTVAKGCLDAQKVFSVCVEYLRSKAC